MQKTHPGHKFSAKQRTADVLTEEEVDFESLLLSPSLVQGLTDSGFEKPSPIQLKAIPLGRCGLDLIAQAKSGTGKTCVFSVIALESINTDTAATQVLILAPTREIAVQVKDVVNAIGCHIKGLNCQVFIGGLPLDEDKKALKGCHVAVGSPGRVKYLIENGFLKTESVRMFILDEADKLLDDNFQEQINWIYSTLPSNKQMMAFSATYPEYLANHLTKYMREPTFVRLNASDPTLQGIKQFYSVVPFHHLPHKVFQEKVEQLVKLLSKVNFHQCLIFSNYQIRAQSLSSTLCSKGWPATFIAGSQTQQKRLQAMEKLKDFKCRILISTDLTARGIDAENVNLVVNMDIPRDGETYLHRIGRAGRFGTKGVAVTFVAKGKEEKDLKELQKSIGVLMEALPGTIPESLMVSETPVTDDQSLQKDSIEVNVLYKNTAIDTFQSTVELSKSKNQYCAFKDKNMDRNVEDIPSKRNNSSFTSELLTGEYCKEIMSPSKPKDGLESSENASKGGVDSGRPETNKHLEQEKSSINCILSPKFDDKNTSHFDKMINNNSTEMFMANIDNPANSKTPESKNCEDFSKLQKNIDKEVIDLSENPTGIIDQVNHTLPSVDEFDKDFEEYLAFTNETQTTFQGSNEVLEISSDIFHHQNVNDTSPNPPGSCIEKCSDIGWKNECENDDVQSVSSIDDYDDNVDSDACGYNYNDRNDDEKVASGCGTSNESSLSDDGDPGDSFSESDSSDDGEVPNGRVISNESSNSNDDPSSNSCEGDSRDDGDTRSGDHTSESQDDSADDNYEQHNIQTHYEQKYGKHTLGNQTVLHSEIQIDSSSNKVVMNDHPINGHWKNEDLTKDLSHRTNSNNFTDGTQEGSKESRTKSVQYNSCKNKDEWSQSEPGFGSYRKWNRFHSDISSSQEDHNTLYNHATYQQFGQGHMEDEFDRNVDYGHHFNHGSETFNSHTNSNQMCCGNTVCPGDLQWRRAWYSSFYTINSTIRHFGKKRN